MPLFLDAVAARFVEDYIAPLNVRQRVVYPEFVDMVKTLVLHLDSTEALPVPTGVVAADGEGGLATGAARSACEASVLRQRRERLWALFQAMDGLVVFTVPMIHHLAQSLATKDAVMLLGGAEDATRAGAGAGSGARADASASSGSSVSPLPLPTLVHSLWSLCLHHGRVEALTLEYLFLALFRYYRTAQEKRGLRPRVLRSVEYYRHVLYDTPYTAPTTSHTTAAVPGTKGALTLPHTPASAVATGATSSSLAPTSGPTSFSDVIASGFSPGVLAAYAGLDRLDPPLPNLLHAFFTKVCREWGRLNEEEVAAIWADAKQGMKEAEARGDLALKESLAAEARVRAAEAARTEVPMNVHAFNLLVQSFLLFQASSAAPIRWAALTHVRTAMASRAGGPLLLNHTSTLMLVDALIEARELAQARAILPPVPELPAGTTASSATPPPSKLRGLMLPAALRGSAAANARMNAATAGTIERLFPQGAQAAETPAPAAPSAPEAAVQEPAASPAPAKEEAPVAAPAAAAEPAAPRVGFWARLRRWFLGPEEPQAPVQSAETAVANQQQQQQQPDAASDAASAQSAAAPAKPAASPLQFSAANRAGFAAPNAKNKSPVAPATPATAAIGSQKQPQQQPPAQQAQKQQQQQKQQPKPLPQPKPVVAAPGSSRTSAPPGKKNKKRK